MDDFPAAMFHDILWAGKMRTTLWNWRFEDCFLWHSPYDSDPCFFLTLARRTIGMAGSTSKAWTVQLWAVSTACWCWPDVSVMVSKNKSCDGDAAMPLCLPIVLISSHGPPERMEVFSNSRLKGIPQDSQWCGRLSKTKLHNEHQRYHGHHRQAVTCPLRARQRYVDTCSIPCPVLETEIFQSLPCQAYQQHGPLFLCWSFHGFHFHIIPEATKHMTGNPFLSITSSDPTWFASAVFLLPNLGLTIYRWVARSTLFTASSWLMIISIVLIAIDQQQVALVRYIATVVI